MIFAQFYQKGTTGKLIEACGDRAVIVLDGRKTLLRNKAIAAENCLARHYIGYRLYQGETFTRCTPVTEYVPVELGKILKTHYLASVMCKLHTANYTDCAAYQEMKSLGYTGTPKEVYDQINKLIADRIANEHDTATREAGLPRSGNQVTER